MFDFLGQALVGWLIADLAGGFIHWWLDRVVWPRTSFLEKHVWGPNRVHHAQPLKFAAGSLWERNNSTIIAASILALIWLALMGPSVALAFALVGGAIQNEVHLWTHTPRAGIVKVLQQIGVIQSVAAHARHHKPPQDRNYCILTDWCNPVLEHFSVWRRLEKRLGISDDVI